MLKIIRASLLVLALSCLTHAGNMPTPAPDPQSAPTTSSTTQETADGNSPNDQPAKSTVTEAVLNLLQGVLSLL